MIPLLAALVLVHAPAPGRPCEASFPPQDFPGGKARLHYTVGVQAPQAGETARVDVSLEVENPPLGAWGFPDDYAYVRLPEPLLELAPRVSVASGDTSAVLERDSPYGWTLASPPGAAAPPERLTITYSVALDHRQEPAVIAAQDAHEFPYLDEQHGLLVAGTLFFLPLTGELADTRVTFDLPPTWPVLAPWSEVEPGVFAPRGRLQLVDDLIAVGLWNQNGLQRDGFEVTLAFAPGQEAFVPRAVPTVMRVVEEELDLFGRAPFERYLFVFGRPDGHGFAGSPKSGSMTLQVAPDAPAPIVQQWLGHLVAHEFYHTWMRSIALLGPDLRFFGEGYTDYFAYLVLGRLGELDMAGFERVLGEKLTAYEQAASATGLSLVEAGGEAYDQDPRAYHQVVSGGLILAAWHDLALRRTSAELGAADLDGFARDFHEDPRWSERAPNRSAFLKLTADGLGEDLGRRVGELLETRGPIDWEGEFACIGVALEREQRAATDLRANLQGTTLRDLDPFGPAARFGLRPGDRILSINEGAPEDARAVRAAWVEAADGETTRILLDRAGEQVRLEAEHPQETSYSWPDATFAGPLGPATAAPSPVVDPAHPEASAQDPSPETDTQ